MLESNSFSVKYSNVFQKVYERVLYYPIYLCFTYKFSRILCAFSECCGTQHITRKMRRYLDVSGIDALKHMTVCLMTLLLQNLRLTDLILVAFTYCIAIVIVVIKGKGLGHMEVLQIE